MLPTASTEATTSAGGPLIGQTYNSLLVSTSTRTNTELPLLATLQPRRPPLEATAALPDYPSDYGLPYLGKSILDPDLEKPQQLVFPTSEWLFNHYEQLL